MMYAKILKIKAEQRRRGLKGPNGTSLSSTAIDGVSCHHIVVSSGGDLIEPAGFVLGEASLRRSGNCIGSFECCDDPLPLKHLIPEEVILCAAIVPAVEFTDLVVLAGFEDGAAT